MSAFRARYGAGPLHLIALVVSLAVAGYAALMWTDAPQTVRLVVWFAGALIAHDLILFPLYALVDRGLVAALPVRAINYVRVPAMLSALLLLIWYPLILKRPEAQYRSATGLGLSPYLGRYLLVVAVLFGGSLLLYAARLVRAARSRAEPQVNAGTATASTLRRSGSTRHAR